LEIANLGEEELQEFLEHDHGFGVQCDKFCVDNLDSFENKYLGHVWAAVQAELLTYRRLDDHDPWNSDDFDMVTLLDNLRSGTEPSIGMVQKSVMKPYCVCGRFQGTANFALREEATKDYVSNLDDWNRATFILVPRRLWEAYYT